MICNQLIHPIKYCSVPQTSAVRAILSVLARPVFFQPRTSMNASCVMIIFMCMLYKDQ